MPTLLVLAFLFLMDTDGYYKVGYVIKTHGLKGEVTIALDSGRTLPEVHKALFIQHGDQFVPHFIEHHSLRGQKAFVKFEDISTIEDAEQVAGCGVFLPIKSRPKPAKGAFYGDEVIGFQVRDHAGSVIGIVAEVSEGPNPQLIVHHHEKEVLIPLNGPFIQQVQRSKKEITVDLPEGLLDI
ncbi:MAG: 16S rRNA processing protein RimM [Bacteroidetes bacterium]|nr:16S rRNA processing protein RimM [Bacteroidota bacterium]